MTTDRDNNKVLDAYELGKMGIIPKSRKQLEEEQK